MWQIFAYVGKDEGHPNLLPDDWLKVEDGMKHGFSVLYDVNNPFSVL